MSIAYNLYEGFILSFVKEITYS